MQEYRDYYFRKAKSENYPARSVYKLKEMDARHHILKSGMKILDLGAAPGSWSLGAAEKIGAKGLVIGVDIQAVSINFPSHVKFFQSDIFNLDPAVEREIRGNMPFDLVLSDMAPNTTGNKFVDQSRSLDLAGRALDVAKNFLRPGGNFIVKIFMGPDARDVLDSMKAAFNSVKTFKPKSSRAESKEIFYMGFGLKRNKISDNSEIV